MSQTRGLELFEALQGAGFTPDDARKVTTIIVASDSDLVTKTDLRAELAELKADIIKWNVGTLAVVIGIVAALKIFS